ncbi:MAG: SLBB domain-containing protein [Bacilli bacterium]|nr:SLBB domain-containing protein [Bacilli bacterium]
MQKLTKVNPYPSILVSSTVVSYEKPDCVYIPITNGSNFVVKKDDSVSIGTPLLKTKNSITTSPISGKVHAITKMLTNQGLVDTLEIINDFKEKTVIDPILKNNLKNIKKDKLQSLLRTYFKLDFTNKKHLILNCIDDEPYVFTESFYLLLYYEGYLELLDKLAKIYDIPMITICLKSTSSENISKLMECLGMYPNITLNIVPDLYLLGRESMLLQYLNLAPSNSLVIKAHHFYHVHNLILRNRQISDKLITISGTAVKNPSVVRVKIGTKLKDCLEGVITTTGSELIYLAGGLMQGKIINLENFIITEDLTGLIIMPKKEEPVAGKCLNCGACIDICPVGINPLLLKEPNYYEQVKDKCISCGLCSYICPSFINFNEYLEGGHHE